MSWKKVKLKQILKQYRIEHLVQNDIEYKQVTISKYDGVTFRGTKMGREIGRKRQFQIDLKKFPNTLMFVRQGIQDGSIGIAPLEVDGCIATENMPMFSVEGINFEYLKFLLKSPNFYDELNKIQTTGSAQKSIHEREILEIEIPFPPIEKQEEIVKILSNKKNNSLELATEIAHQLSLVKKLRQQLLQDAVQGKLVAQNKKDEPASELLKKIKTEKEKLIAEKKLKKEKELPPIKPEEIPFKIPESWVWCRLGVFSKLITDGTHKTPIYMEEGIPFLSAQNLSFNKIDYHKIKYISIEEYNQYFKNKELNFGDVLLAKSGTLGISAVFENNERFAFYESIAQIKLVLPFINSKYISYYLNYNSLNFIREKQKGIGVKHLHLVDVREFEIPIPPFSEQSRIVQKLDELMQYCNDLEASIKESEAQNVKLLQQVLREALRKN